MIENNMNDEKILFIENDCERMLNSLHNIRDELCSYTVSNEDQHVQNAGTEIKNLSNLFFKYTPYMDLLAHNLEELGTLILEEKEFIDRLQQKTKKTLILFDAICTDLELYVQRFSIETLAMENIHQIHEPTSLSIRQIIGFIKPEEVDDGGMEFF